mmetsp:Transcript_3507/g.4660  ORF Transcript_3507/g.4660 Transcript_3507/m.4660 type:complete len:209 (-) Transcript_3507:690-1316(-)
MKRMYLAGADVLGPMSPKRCKICVDSIVNSQSSMNSHRCRSDDSVVSGTALINVMMELTIVFLNANPPSSRRKLDMNPTRIRCLAGYVKHRRCRLLTIVILYSSAMSDKKEEICFNNRSMEFSLPVRSRVVMARVAMNRFESEMSDSRSSLHLATRRGCVLETSARIFMDPNRVEGLELFKKFCRMEMAGLISCASADGNAQMALAAS